MARALRLARRTLSVRASLSRVGRAVALVSTVIRFGSSPLFRWLLRLPPPEPRFPVRVRLALEHLGLTYLKMGQYLAMRFDILPAEICRELGGLFEGVAPMKFEIVEAVVATSLRAPVDSIFDRFDPAPLAAASVAQVHEAWTREGRHVAVKVQRRGVERIFRADIANLRWLTRLADAIHLLGRLSATELLDEFFRWTLQELDFMAEGRTADRVAAWAAPYEKIPEVLWELTSPQVLTLEFIEGASLAQIVAEVDEDGTDRLDQVRPGLDINLVLHHMTFASLRQIFMHGVFHGDPHPGNILVQADNSVAFVDFGIFGTLAPYDRDLLGRQIENLAFGQIDESLRYYIAQLSVTEQSDVEGFRKEARRVLQSWFDESLRPGAPLESRHVGRYIGLMIDISRRYGLRYDMSYVLYWRAINALDSTCLRLSREFDLIGELRKFFEQIRPDLTQRFVDAVLNERSWATLAGLAMESSHLVRQAIDRSLAGMLR